jgi:hypothetical protein
MTSISLTLLALIHSAIDCRVFKGHAKATADNYRDSFTRMPPGIVMFH